MSSQEDLQFSWKTRHLIWIALCNLHMNKIGGKGRGGEGRRGAGREGEGRGGERREGEERREEERRVRFYYHKAH